MQKCIACLLLVMLLGMMPLLLPAQQNQNTRKSDSEIEALKKRLSEIEKQLQTVENVEKLKLQAELAEANTKLIDAEFSKFERGLRDSNDDWLRKWGSLFANVIGVFVAVSSIVIIVVGGIFWSWFKSKADSFIADEVEKSLNGFKEAVDQVEEMKDELGLLKKDHAAFVLEASGIVPPEEHHHPQQIKSLSDADLLQVFKDERYRLQIRYRAAEVLAARRSPHLIPPLLNLLKSLARSDLDPHDRFDIPPPPPLLDAVKFLRDMHTPEAYEGLKEFLNTLLTEDPTSKNWFLEETVFSLVQVGIKLNMGDSVLILKKALQDLENPGHEVLGELVEYFDIFNEPASIKKILDKHLTDEPSNMTVPEGQLADRCRELLQEHYPDL